MNQVVSEEDQVSVILDNEEISDANAMSGSNQFQIVSASDCFAHFVANGFSKLDQSSLESCIIQTSVSHNLRMVKGITGMAIHRNLNTSRSWQVRAHSFRLSMKAVALKCGGDANVRYAWYGAPRDEIFDIVTHGFSWSMKAGADTHSISLSPPKHLLHSVLSSTANGSGLRHLLLCRVILGKQEVVTGDSSQQYHPSSPELDSGVDHISDPSKYMVWNSRLNSTILPCYIVSFQAPCLTLSGLGGGGREEAKTIKPWPSSSWITFPSLISILSRFLDQSRKASLKRHYTDFQEKRITKPQMIQRVKQIAGIQLLSALLRVYAASQGSSS